MQDSSASSFRLDLPRHGLLTVADVAGVGIECQAGCVWLTLDDDPRDLVLEAGERFVGDIHRRVLVSAFEASSIAVSHAQPAALPVARSRFTAAPDRLPHGLSPA